MISRSHKFVSNKKLITARIMGINAFIYNKSLLNNSAGYDSVSLANHDKYCVADPGDIQWGKFESLPANFSHILFYNRYLHNIKNINLVGINATACVANNVLPYCNKKNTLLFLPTPLLHYYFYYFIAHFTLFYQDKISKDLVLLTILFENLADRGYCDKK